MTLDELQWDIETLNRLTAVPVAHLSPQDIDVLFSVIHRRQLLPNLCLADAVIQLTAMAREWNHSLNLQSQRFVAKQNKPVR